MKIDFVSDVVCPWCAIGLNGLQQAVERLGPGAGQVEWHVHPFELNPLMAPEGEDIGEHLQRKYGATPAQGEATRETIRQRGASVGFEFRLDKRSRIYNTFDAHRLLHWSASQGPGRQLALKKALLSAYFTDGNNPGARDVLLRCAAEAGLDADGALAVIDSDAGAAEVRALEQRWQQLGIHSVPSIIINDRHLIQGGQPPEVFEQALRQILAEAG